MRTRGVVRGLGIIGTAAGLCLGAGVAQAAPTAADAGSGALASVGQHAASKATRVDGFVPVRQLTYQPLAGVSPSKGELWLVGGSPTSGSATLEHLRNGRWTTEQLAGVGASGAALAATAHDDVWMTIGGTLRHYDGHTWTTVSLPPGPAGVPPLTAQNVATASRGTAYVALTSVGWGYNGHLFRYDHGQWTDLGLPPAADHTFGFMPTRMAVVGPDVSVVVEPPHAIQAYDYAGGTWSGPVSLGAWWAGYVADIGGYVVTPDRQHLAFGGAGFMGEGPVCVAWTAAAPQPCHTTQVAGGAALLKDGSIVIGGKDYLTPKDLATGAGGTTVEGRFVLRGPDGTERQLAGDPGAGTVLMVAEAHRNAAWAATRNGALGDGNATYELQYYAG